MSLQRYDYTLPMSALVLRHYHHYFLQLIPCFKFEITLRKSIYFVHHFLIILTLTQWWRALKSSEAKILPFRIPSIRFVPPLSTPLSAYYGPILHLNV